MDEYVVICPYCGGKMQCTEPHIHTNRNGIGVKLQCHFWCPDCRSGAPWVDIDFASGDECREAAYKKALGRVN